MEKVIKKKRVDGKVTSVSMQKTVKVEVERSIRHPKYQKTMKRQRVFMAHTENELQLGDVVTIQESRPYSKTVKWEVVAKLNK